jgi:hypothetical protein
MGVDVSWLRTRRVIFSYSSDLDLRDTMRYAFLHQQRELTLTEHLIHRIIGRYRVPLVGALKVIERVRGWSVICWEIVCRTVTLGDSQTCWRLPVIVKPRPLIYRGIVVRFLAGAGDFSLFPSVKLGSASHPSPCLMSIRHIDGDVFNVICTQILCVVRVRTERISAIYLG